jgi:hypothetical protein
LILLFILDKFIISLFTISKLKVYIFASIVYYELSSLPVAVEPIKV